MALKVKTFRAKLRCGEFVGLNFVLNCWTKKTKLSIFHRDRLSVPDDQQKAMLIILAIFPWKLDVIILNKTSLWKKKRKFYWPSFLEVPGKKRHNFGCGEICFCCFSCLFALLCIALSNQRSNLSTEMWNQIRIRV